jgi:DNA-binding IclR family transcriptional regulator
VRTFLSALDEARARDLLSSGTVLLADAYGGGLKGAAEELARVREAGVAVNDGLTTPEEFGVSAPVWDYRERMAGCVIASAPRSRIDREARERLEAAIKETAAAVSARLGYGAKRAEA